MLALVRAIALDNYGKQARDQLFGKIAAALPGAFVAFVAVISVLLGSTMAASASSSGIDGFTMAGSTLSMAGSTLGGSPGRGGFKQQLHRLEAAVEQSSAALSEAADSAASDKEELKQLISATEQRIMAEIERLRSETANQMAVLRQGIDQTRKTLKVYKGESTAQAEKLRAQTVRGDGFDKQLQRLIREFDGDGDLQQFSVDGGGEVKE